MNSSNDIIERPVIDTRGRLGSHYDAIRDSLVSQLSLSGYENPGFPRSLKFQLLSGKDANTTFHLLKSMKFDDTLLHSLLFGIIEPRGIYSLINYDQTINEHTCFLYCLYEHKEESFDIGTQQIHQTVPLPSSSSSAATHMITKIVWGFEILCVIQNSNRQSADSIEKLLYKLSRQFQCGDETLRLSSEERDQIEKLSNVTVFGTETCIDNSAMTLSKILNEVRVWQRHTSDHRPVSYTMCPLNLIYSSQRFPILCRLSPQDQDDVKAVETGIIRLHKSILDLKRTFKKLPDSMVHLSVDQCGNYIERQYTILLRKCDQFRKEIGDMLTDARQGHRQYRDLYNIIFDSSSLSLRKSETKVLYDEVKRYRRKLKLIKKLQKHQIIYSDILNILQSEAIQSLSKDTIKRVEEHFSNEYGSVTLWCSSHQLKREKSTEWKKTYKSLLSNQRQIPLVYVDFTNYHPILQDFIVIRLLQKSKSSPNSSESKRRFDISY